METIIEILIDNSNSMGPWKTHENNGLYLLPDGNTRMSLAKAILIDEILPSFDYGSKITVRKFHSGKDGPLIEKIYDSDFNLDKLTQIIKSIPDPNNTGGTPITAAIKESIKALVAIPNSDKKIILITDGEENQGEDYQRDTEVLLKENGILFVVGIAQSEAAKSKSKELVANTGGTYIDLQSKAYSKLDIQQKLFQLKLDAINHSIQNKTASSPEPIQTGEGKQNPKEEEGESQSIVSEEIAKFEKIIQLNTSTIALIAKQLGNLSEEIKYLRKANTTDSSDGEVLIEENSELNERVRVASESALFTALKPKFGDRLKWLNEEKELGESHDFEVIDTTDNSIEYYIECKGSMYPEKIFYLTKNEWHHFLANSKNYQLYFVSNALSNPQITKIDNFMDWLRRGKVVPYAGKNLKIKKERIVFTVID